MPLSAPSEFDLWVSTIRAYDAGAGNLQGSWERWWYPHRAAISAAKVALEGSCEDRIEVALDRLRRLLEQEGVR